ncbi:thiol:disulfide interchange protein DsbA/DsbL [Marilutibacter chinensis]|uniref:Thiol:disulfide interchange protein DsbA n=1 Tax=Marilutibacter chinensis TaxID=2912247 RepID=A0ABS9HVG5_9GAMM|nr:thiol:disulfide interchange protein DsbA/DsbL [Lysobacter chinensis]MCF7222155.1 thiol:disulfide interchange protein DsbA/DsbL [Lysobacter chinensis]
MTSRPTQTGLIRAGLLPLLLLVSTLAACSSETPAPAATPAETATAPAPDTGTTPAAPAEAGEAPAADGSTPEAAGQAAANDNPVVPPQGPAPVLGTDYVEIAGGQPFAPAMGRIEVVEVFGYTCPHCAQFEPVFKAWKARQPADVVVVPLAAPFGGYWEPYARAFYAAESMNLLEKTHDAMFRAVHLERSLPTPPTVAKPEQIAAFYAKFGADAGQFAGAMNSFAVNARMKRVGQFLMRSGVDSTPSLVVNGKYRVTGGRSHEDQLRILDHLVAMERAAMERNAADSGAAAGSR